MNQTSKRVLGWICAASLSLCLAVGPAQARYLSIGHVNLSFYEVTAALIQLVLERMNYNVALSKGPHSEIYPKLAAGEVDLFVAGWLPNAHARYWDQYKDQLVRVTPLYRHARLFWAVPDYVPESEVRQVADLTKPDVAAKMDRTIRGPGADSGLMIGSKRIVEEYGLDRAGYQLAPGKPADWIAWFNANIGGGKWFVMPLWQPQYLNQAAKLRILEEPKNLLGQEDTAYLLAHKDIRDKIDKPTWQALKRIELSIKAVTEMDYMVNVQNMAPREAARLWMAAHPDTVTYWLEPEEE